jgi:hypothetical protein
VWKRIHVTIVKGRIEEEKKEKDFRGEEAYAFSVILPRQRPISTKRALMRGKYCLLLQTIVMT